MSRGPARGPALARGGPAPMRGGATPVQEDHGGYQQPAQQQYTPQPAVIKTEREALIDSFYNFDLGI